MLKLKKIILIILSAIIFFTLGFISSDFLNKKNNNNNEQFYQSGWEAAKQRLEKTGASYERTLLGYEIRAVYGSVEKVENNKIYVKIRPLEPLADPNLDERIVLINSETEIIKYIQKKEELYEQEVEARRQQGITEELSRVEALKMSISELKPGANVVVHADDDITDEKQFIASKIVIYEN